MFTNSGSELWVLKALFDNFTVNLTSLLFSWTVTTVCMLSYKYKYFRKLLHKSKACQRNSLVHCSMPILSIFCILNFHSNQRSFNIEICWGPSYADSFHTILFWDFLTEQIFFLRFWGMLLYVGSLCYYSLINRGGQNDDRLPSTSISTFDTICRQHRLP
jgi:hypothetical protein